ncbi:DUF615 domain-containing protein [Thioalkalivibrio nitratireducens]|nr:DUF615 domain-containing protein [Thioalkalivibrio nitratireducens]
MDLPDTLRAAVRRQLQYIGRLMRAVDPALTEWLESHPATDAQHLRQLIRNARREAAEGRPPRSSRALFRFLAGSRPAGAQALAEPDPDKEQRGR